MFSYFKQLQTPIKSLPLSVFAFIFCLTLLYIGVCWECVLGLCLAGVYAPSIVSKCVCWIECVECVVADVWVHTKVSVHICCWATSAYPRECVGLGPELWEPSNRTRTSTLSSLNPLHETIHRSSHVMICSPQSHYNSAL